MGQATGIRVQTDTLRKRFRWLVVGSILLHLVLTPVAGLVGLAGWWLDRDSAQAPPPEELDAIPIELLDESALPAPTPSDGLPEQDPVEVIDELIEVPESPDTATPDEQPETSPEPSEQAREEAAREAAEQRRREQQLREAERRAAEQARQRAEQERARAAADAGGAAPDAGATEKTVQEGAKKAAPKRRAIENPVALVGKAGEVVESNANLQLILYANRIRKHPVGKRIARMLPRLPQWNDFFGDGHLNPIEDFDQLFAAGPSFYYSQHLFIALAYNTESQQIRQAIDRLVKRNGRWLPDTPVPAAIARADRADRLFVMPKDGKVVYVAPPKLQRQALALGGRSLPQPRGDEAMVALIKNPKKSLWQLGLDIPPSTRDLRVRLTPLPEGAVELELVAHEETEAAAKTTAERVQADLDDRWATLTGVTSLLSRFGFGGLTRGMQLPKLQLRAQGAEIRGELVLQQDHVEFILDRVERHVAYLESGATAPTVPSAKASSAPTPPPRPPAGKPRPMGTSR